MSDKEFIGALGDIEPMLSNSELRKAIEKTTSDLKPAINGFGAQLRGPDNDIKTMLIGHLSKLMKEEASRATLLHVGANNLGFEDLWKYIAHTTPLKDTECKVAAEACIKYMGNNR